MEQVELIWIEMTLFTIMCQSSLLYNGVILFVLWLLGVRVHAEKTAQYLIIQSKQNNKA